MAAKSQAKKEQIIAELQEARVGILDEIAALPPAYRDTVYLGSWTIKDMLAHLAGWDHTNMRAVKSVLAGRLPDFYAHHDRDWATYNASLVAKYKCKPYKKLLASVKESRRQLIGFLQTVPPDAFNKDFGVRFRGIRVTIPRLLEAEAEDERVHYQQVRDFFKDIN